MLAFLFTAFAALLGLAFGSFLNVCITRWPAGESIIEPRSHCRHCTHTLSWWENLPLVSWLILRGRCRSCCAWIGWRYPIVELAVAALWALAWSSYLEKLIAMPELFLVYLLVAIGSSILSWFLVALAVLDLENLWLPDALTLPGIVLGLAFTVMKEIASSYPHTPRPLPVFLHQLGYLLAAAASILLIRWLYQLLRHREGLGLGDAKLMALLTAWLGPSLALLAFAVGVVSGAVIALVMLAILSVRRSPERWAVVKLPLGTFLSIGGIVSNFWGQPILNAYLHWAGL